MIAAAADRTGQVAATDCAGAPTPAGKTPGGGVPTATAPPLRDMLDDQQTDILGQVKHLPRLAALQPLAIGKIAVARVAALRRMRDPAVGNLNALQMRARMPSWPPCLRPDERRRLRFAQSARGLA
jgi:hypothetical protein